MALEKIRSIHENSTVVYSSEHFHSRISSEKEIETLREYLESHYDQVEIIGYFRRQDRLAISGHNTAIQGGAAHSFNFSHLNGVTKYYDYLSLMTMWSNVFGVDRVSVNVYERDRLIGNDIGHDFKAKIFPPKLLARLEERELHFERSNPRLSYSALNTLLEFNKTNFGEMLPARNEAVDFYEHFIDDNRALFEKFGITEGFTDDFSMYPDENHEAPVINVKALLTDYVTTGTKIHYLIG